MKTKSATGGLVYSTDSGRMCPACRRPLASCSCKADAAKTGQSDAAAASRSVTVWRETKGRAGKGVTVVRGLALDAAALEALGKQLKTMCGSGGTVKDGAIEVQGDHAERVVAALRAKGIKAKRAGG